MDMRRSAYKMKQSFVGKPYPADEAVFPVSQEE